ncbi:MAG: hypothetical protein Q4C25_07440, partial [Bacillota bacterium]|nr:hypothetical protein [Bacillota bacterium]
MKTGNVYLNTLLQEYQTQLKEQQKELKAMPPGHLTVRMRENRVNYIQILPPFQPDGQYRVKGITKDERLVKQLARKKYLELSTKQLTIATSKLERFLENYQEPLPQDVLRQLPKSYRQLPEEWLFPEKSADDKWVTEEYPRNTDREHEKIHITGRGLRVRSKSELIIAEKLDAYNLPYRYEQLIGYENYVFSPDFIIKARRRLFYWEHCGMMADPRYRKRNKWKLTMYEKMGIVPWKNLIVTYDTEDGGIHSAIIEAEIRNKLL